MDLRGLLFEPGRESLYFFLLLRGLFLLQRDRYLQFLNFAIQHGLLGGAFGCLARGGLGRKSTRVGSFEGLRAEPSIGIDEHGSRRRGVNRRTKNVVNKAPVTYLAKNTVDTRQMADDDIVIGRGDTIPGVGAHKHVEIYAGDTIPSLITHRHVLVAAGAFNERVIAHGLCYRTPRSAARRNHPKHYFARRPHCPPAGQT